MLQAVLFVVAIVSFVAGWMYAAGKTSIKK